MHEWLERAVQIVLGVIVVAFIMLTIFGGIRLYVRVDRLLTKAYDYMDFMQNAIEREIEEVTK